MAKLRNVLQLSTTPKEYDPQKINNIFRQVIEWAKELTALVNGNLDYPDNLIEDPSAASHTRSHSIIGTSDHTSAATSGKMLKANANGLPVDATNTDTEVSTAVGYLNQDVKTTASPSFVKILTPEIKTDTTAATDLTITTGAAKTLVLATSVYDDIIIQALNLRPSGTTPPTFGIFQDSIYGINFTNSQTDIVYGSFEIPHTYKEGTTLEVHLHWSPDSANTGACVWIMKYSIALNGGTFGGEATLNFSQVGSGTINKHQYVSADATIPGTSIGAIATFALSRPTGDAFSGNAFLHSIGVHYQIDTMGSRQLAIK